MADKGIDVHYIGDDLKAAYDEGYKHGKADAQTWICVKDRLPECEQEVLVITVRDGKRKMITTALYEDGTMTDEDSLWNWIDVPIYDEDSDRYIIPEGWWEYRHYNGDDIYNNVIDDTVTHWMPLPEFPEDDDK